MNNILEQTESGREIARRNREEGREEGITQSNINSMRLLLQVKFGDIADLDDLARRLAGDGYAENFARIAAGAPLDDLRSEKVADGDTDG